MTETMHASDAPPVVVLNIERYAHGSDPARYPGDRGTRVSAETRFASGLVFSTHFPDVFVSDSGDVDMGDLRIPAEDAVAWLRALADHIQARRDAS